VTNLWPARDSCQPPGSGRVARFRVRALGTCHAHLGHRARRRSHAADRPARRSDSRAGAELPPRQPRRPVAGARAVPGVGPVPEAPRGDSRASPAGHARAGVVRARNGDARGARPSRDPPRVCCGRDRHVRLPYGQLDRGREPRRRVAARTPSHPHRAVAHPRSPVGARTRPRPRHHHAAHRALDADDQHRRPGRHHRSALRELVPTPRARQRHRGGVHGARSAGRRARRAGERRLYGDGEHLRRAHRPRTRPRPGGARAAAAAAPGHSRGRRAGHPAGLCRRTATSPPRRCSRIS